MSKELDQLVRLVEFKQKEHKERIVYLKELSVYFLFIIAFVAIFCMVVYFEK